MPFKAPAAVVVKACKPLNMKIHLHYKKVDGVIVGYGPVISKIGLVEPDRVLCAVSLLKRELPLSRNDTRWYAWGRSKPASTPRTGRFHLKYAVKR